MTDFSEQFIARIDRIDQAHSEFSNNLYNLKLIFSRAKA